MMADITRRPLVAAVSVALGAGLAFTPACGGPAARPQADPGASVPGDGSVLPFPPAPSGSKAGLAMQESTYKRRVEPKRLAEGAPNILIIRMGDVGPATPSTDGGEINTPTLDRVAKMGISFNRFHSTALFHPEDAPASSLTEWTFDVPMTRMPESAAPKLGKADSPVTMDVDVPASASGVLCALAGFSGA